MTKENKSKTGIVNESLVQTIRISLGIATAEKLAEQAGVDNYVVWRAERGNGILDENIYKISSSLNLSPDILFYSLGKIPQSLVELIRDDPLYFKSLVDVGYAIPRKENLTKGYIESLKAKMEEIRLKELQNAQAEMAPLLSDLAPSS